MALIGVFLLVILIVSAVLLVLVVLVQDDQGEGIGGIFGGGSTTPFGSRSGNILTRFTAILAAVFLFCIFALAWVNRTPEAGNVIGRARAESLSGGSQQQNWWVQTPAPTAGAAANPGTPLTPGAANPLSTSPAPGTPAPAGSSAPTPAQTPAPTRGGN